MKLILSIVFAMSAFVMQAQASNTFFNAKETQKATMLQAQLFGLDWTVNDTADYKINIGGFIKGTMKSLVREETGEGFWVQQDMDIMGQQNKVEILFDKNTGQVLQLIVNGEKKEIPNGDDQEVIDMQEANITVPAGSFDCIYVKIKNKKDNSESEAWINPELIPVGGLLKQLAPSQMGKVTVELTSFNKQ